MSQEAMHASAPEQHLCADCTMDKEACPICYKAWWQRRHPNTIQIDAALKGKGASQGDGMSESASATITSLYYELLYAVGNKYPGETRHQTALRYIRRAEKPSTVASQAASPDEQKG